VWIAEVGEEIRCRRSPGTGGEPLHIEKKVRRLVVAHAWINRVPVL